MNEVDRIADQFQRAVEGGAWHGPSLNEILSNVNAHAANSKPLDKVHSIHEILKHVTAWNKAVLERLKGKVISLDGEEDWPPVEDFSSEVWIESLKDFKTSSTNLYNYILQLPEEKLNDIYIEKTISYSIYFLLHGIVQHNLYHAGQMAILKKQLV